MLITRDLNFEFQRARRQRATLGMLREAAAEQGSIPYSYLTPGLVGEPKVGGYPMPVRVGGGIARVGQNSIDSGRLTEVEKRSIMRYAGRIQYTEPEISDLSHSTVMLSTN